MSKFINALVANPTHQIVPKRIGQALTALKYDHPTIDPSIETAPVIEFDATWRMRMPECGSSAELMRRVREHLIHAVYGDFLNLLRELETAVMYGSNEDVHVAFARIWDEVRQEEPKR